ncbi:MAG: alanine--tRNA ligase [Firmicutes bacterium]|nr:alanine--tRNA ligase [Alicyclobacillaceae bacterium]MCL6496630.1 alanine--tRNA ligase [Bacillota bacterium]
MQSRVIREKFLRYFEQRGHQVVPSSPLVPAGDPTLLFTNAGMVQFKEVFLGRERRSYTRAASAQKCMRAGGKHNDLDQVGRTARHLTFFEMLGNFSFGDYFKAEAIAFAWEFLVHELGIPREVLWVTVYRDDDEAAELWQKVAHLPPARIVRLGEHDNFWSMGDTGPCGPSSEIYIDRGPAFACGADCGIGRCGCDRYEEIWNLVFMQYDRSADGRLTPLPRPSIDTGMGLERIASYLQGVESNFETDLLRPLVAEVERLSGQPYDPGPAGLPFRVIADHVRAITFLLAEGVTFSNEGRGYVLRRILRRAARYGFQLGFEAPFLFRLAPTVGQVMGAVYPEVERGLTAVVEQIRAEEARFGETLAQGMRVLNERLAGLGPGGVLSGEDAFLLYDTYGFPLDLCIDVARERGIGVDQAGFEVAMAAQRERARAARRARGETLPERPPARFVGYERETEAQAVVDALVVEGQQRGAVTEGEEVWVHLPVTPFYPEGGGQVGDHGTLTGPEGWAEVVDVVRAAGSIWHLAVVKQGRMAVGEPVAAQVDPEWRRAVRRNHTGTHLLHAALRQVLGEDVRQTGSLVAPNRLRFDFSYPKPLAEAEIEAVEALVNRWILEDRPVETVEMTREEALERGALAFFGDKYGERVRVVEVPGASMELCGGTHCRRTGEIGSFFIVEESGIAAGVRRVEAVTGWNSVRLTRGLLREHARLAAELRVPGEAVVSKVAALLADLRAKEAELSAARLAGLRAQGAQLGQEAESEGGFRWVVREVPVKEPADLRTLVDGLRELVDSAILVSRWEDRVAVAVYVGPRWAKSGVRADAAVKRLAPFIGGSGGGRADLAQAGGRRVEGVADLLQAAQAMVREWVHAESQRPSERVRSSH